MGIILRVRRLALSAVMAAVLAVGPLAATTGSVFADYGQGAQYQVEISDNCTNLQGCTVVGAQGFGVWLWIELDGSGTSTSGTGTYNGADCGHVPTVPGASGAFSDSGTVKWSLSGNTLTIWGVGLFGGAMPVTITVPASYGHSVETTQSVFGIPLPGRAQVQVAP